MSQRIYVGNLPFSTSKEELEQLFSTHGEVTQVDLVMDRDTGRPRGFGFVDMATGAEEAIATLNGQSLGDRPLKVNEARPRAPRSQQARW